MSDVQTWSTTAASNNSAAPNGFPEGMPPSGVNDAAREVMAAVARYREDTDGVNTSSGTDTITLASSRTMTAYAQGDMYTFKAGGTNTGATTLNVDSLGAKDVQFNGAACTGGEIITDLMYTVVYDGTQFQLMNAASYPAIDIETLEVTNIKAKDGTASMTIADSTGVVTAGTLNATTIDTNNIEVTNIKAKDGTASATIAYSTGIFTHSTATVFPAGTVSDPAITTAGDANTGIFFPAADTIGFAEGGAEAVRITSDGYMGIGTTSPSSPLHVSYDGSLILGGHVGLKLQNTSTGGNFVDFIDSAGTVQGNIFYNHASNYMEFGTSDSGTRSQKLRILGNGNIGIGGINAPATLLDIAASNNGLTSDTANNTVRFTDTDTTTIANQPIGKIEFYTSDSGNAGVAGYILATARGNAGGGNIIFGAAPNAGSPSDIFQVTNLGAFILNSAATIGYTIGAGAAVTQTTSRTTGVTIDAPCGAITLVSAAGSTTIQSFTVTNSVVSSTDTIIVNQKSGTDLYRIYVTAVGTGSFRISYATLSGTTTEQPVFNFCVIAGRAS